MGFIQNSLGKNATNDQVIQVLQQIVQQVKKEQEKKSQIAAREAAEARRKEEAARKKREKNRVDNEMIKTLWQAIQTATNAEDKQKLLTVLVNISKQNPDNQAELEKILKV